jgi:phospholipid N-methyltransferase
VSDATNHHGLREHVLIFKRFLRNPRTVGAVSSSSRALARQMVSAIPTDRPVTVVELGPGTGAFTDAIVRRVAPGSRILAFEIEPLFVSRIRERWPSVDCVETSAEHLEQVVRERGVGAVDHVVSGLPYASLPAAMTEQVIDGVARTLRAGGTFTTFQYVHGFAMPPGRTFRRLASRRLETPVERRFVARNFPPTYILSWRKPAS